MMRLACGVLLALAACAAFAAPAIAPLVDWRADSLLAAHSRKPVVLFFTLPGCRFCADLRLRYMLPLLRDGQLVREIEIGNATPVDGLAGSATQDAVARRFGVRVAPTVLLVDSQGRPLADPIVGGDLAGMYGGYLLTHSNGPSGNCLDKLGQGRSIRSRERSGLALRAVQI